MADDRPIEVTSAANALARASENDLRRYPAPDRDGDRLYPLAAPHCTPTFKIGSSDTIFAIGSCFARNVERALATAGKVVLSRNFDLGAIGEGLGDAANFFNKYSIHSVINEVRWALERDSFPGAQLFYEIGRQSYSDCQLGLAKLEHPIEDILAFRHRYLDAIAQVATADVVILTLGYVETWYDRELGLYLNVAPPVRLVKKTPERFEFRVMSYADVLQGLEELYALLLRHRTKPLKMLVTVSPVPLLATFRNMDVLVANAYSKSVQRAALEEFVRGKPGVDYFPSFEFVTLSNPTIAWSRGDYRHVSPDVVNRIMSDVLSNYVEAHPGSESGDMPALTSETLLSTARMLSKLEEHQQVAELMEANRAIADGDGELLMLEAVSLRQLGRDEDAWDRLATAVKVDPARPVALERLITLCRPLRRREDAARLLDLHAQRFPKRSEFRGKIGWV